MNRGSFADFTLRKCQKVPHRSRQYYESKELHSTKVTRFSTAQNGAHIIDLETIGFVTSGLGQLSIT